MTTVRIDRDRHVWTVTIDRPEVRNAVDGPTARALADAFRAFDADDEARVAVLTGADGQFCAGADLRTVAGGSATANANALDDDIARDGPMGPSRLELGKPVIAAVEGFAVAGGLELALWCDARVAAATATFGVFCRRFGVPLIDGGTVRLPRLIGESRATELLLTGRKMGAAEALAAGLVTAVVPAGQLADAASGLADQVMATSPFSTWMTKELIDANASAGSLRHAIQNENRTQVLCNYTGDIAEAVTAFREGRPPAFR